MSGVEKERLSKWRRGIAEFLVIAVGVGTALAADAWWEERRDGLREREYIDRLRVDIARTDSLLREAIGTEKELERAGRRVVEALNAPTLASGDSLSSLTFAVLGFSSFYPSMGTVEALVISGELAVISDPVLRSRLAEYHSEVTRYLRLLEHRTRDATDIVFQSLYRRVSRLAVSGDIDPRRLPIDWESLANDPVFVGDMTSLSIVAGNRAWLLERIGESLASLQAAVPPL